MIGPNLSEHEIEPKDCAVPRQPSRWELPEHVSLNMSTFSPSPLCSLLSDLLILYSRSYTSSLRDSMYK